MQLVRRRLRHGRHRRRSRRERRGGGSRLSQRGVETLDNRGKDFHRRKAPVVRFDNRPGGEARVRAGEHLFKRLQIGVILLMLPPIFFRHFPRRRLGFFEFLKAFALLFLADVQEEFDEERAAVGQLPLK